MGDFQKEILVVDSLYFFLPFRCLFPVKKIRLKYRISRSCAGVEQHVLDVKRGPGDEKWRTFQIKPEEEETL